MVRSAPPPNVSLPDVITAPLMAASVETFSTIPSSSSITDTSMTFIVLPGMSQVISAMPSASTSSLKFAIAVSPRETRLAALVRLAVEVKDANGGAIAFEFEVRARIVRALGRRARPDFKQQHLGFRAVHDAMAVRHAGFPARAVAGLQDRLATVGLDQRRLALKDVDELILLLVPMQDRCGRPWFKLREIHPELREPDRIAERGLVTARTRRLERRRIVRRTDP